LKYGYARGYEAFQYVENIRRYMNSIMNYYRVQQNQNDKNDDISNNSATNSPEENKHAQEKNLKTN
jgi:membrane-bound lytic murein transglycosylase F